MRASKVRYVSVQYSGFEGADACKCDMRCARAVDPVALEQVRTHHTKSFCRALLEQTLISTIVHCFCSNFTPAS